MRILNKSDCIEEIVDLVRAKAMYQKVVLCLDENSDMKFVDDILELIGKQVVLLTYYYNKNNISTFNKMVDNGTRIVIYNVSAEHYYQVQTDNNYILNVFFPQSNFILPYISHTESVYGDNLLICDVRTKDYTTLLFMYELAFHKIWGMLLQGFEVDTQIFKNLDAIANGKVDFYSSVLNQMCLLKQNLSNEYQSVGEREVPYYIYLRLCAVFKMLESLVNGNEQYIDFYKTELSVSYIEKAHNLLIKHNVISMLKLNAGNMLCVAGAILNRIKIIVKKYFNFKNIKLINLNKIIKKQSKDLKIDNLLYISYIFNSIN